MTPSINSVGTPVSRDDDCNSLMSVVDWICQRCSYTCISATCPVCGARNTEGVPITSPKTRRSTLKSSFMRSRMKGSFLGLGKKSNKKGLEVNHHDEQTKEALPIPQECHVHQENEYLPPALGRNPASASTQQGMLRRVEQRYNRSNKTKPVFHGGISQQADEDLLDSQHWAVGREDVKNVNSPLYIDPKKIQYTNSVSSKGFPANEDFHIASSNKWSDDESDENYHPSCVSNHGYESSSNEAQPPLVRNRGCEDEGDRPVAPLARRLSSNRRLSPTQTEQRVPYVSRKEDLMSSKERDGNQALFQRSRRQSRSLNVSLRPMTSSSQPATDNETPISAPSTVAQSTIPLPPPQSPLNHISLRDVSQTKKPSPGSSRHGFPDSPPLHAAVENNASYVVSPKVAPKILSPVTASRKTMGGSRSEEYSSRGEEDDPVRTLRPIRSSFNSTHDSLHSSDSEWKAAMNTSGSSLGEVTPWLSRSEEPEPPRKSIEQQNMTQKASRIASSLYSLESSLLDSVKWRSQSGLSLKGIESKTGKDAHSMGARLVPTRSLTKQQTIVNDSDRDEEPPEGHNDHDDVIVGEPHSVEDESRIRISHHGHVRSDRPESRSFMAWSEEEKQSPWICAACTYENENALHLTCAVCGTLREQGSSSSALQGSNNADDYNALRLESSQKDIVKTRSQLIEEEWLQKLQRERVDELVQLQRELYNEYQQQGFVHKKITSAQVDERREQDNARLPSQTHHVMQVHERQYSERSLNSAERLMEELGMSREEVEEQRHQWADMRARRRQNQDMQHVQDNMLRGQY